MLRNLTLTIIFQGRKKNISARAADNLLDVLRKFGMAPESPCGGTGKCGKCRVVTVEPHNKKRESVLACRIFLNCDLIVEIPEFNKYTVNSGEIIPECENKPYFFTEEIILDENYPVLPDVLQKKCRAADHKTVWVIKKHGCPEKTLDIFTSRPRCLGLAVDLGTTTLAAVLYDLENGKQLSQSSMASSQRAFGHNVISRLQYSLQPNGLTELQKLAAGDITRLAENCCAAANENTGDIYETVVSGNTVMMHLAAGVSPETLAVVPFSPAIMGGNFKAGHLGIKIHNEAEIYFTRAIGSFVGGDITSGVLALNLADAPRPLLFIDIGTNGEIVLFGEEKIFACSAAAGPAFEGGNISCGMSAAGGAISSVKLMDQALR
ncbi:MAG TPA: hypothetical protein DC049_16625, partial [Spirochaetia bacterium]|nr:hypothetical protein [Spirochaetia bacterium]